MGIGITKPFYMTLVLGIVGATHASMPSQHTDNILRIVIHKSHTGADGKLELASKFALLLSSYLFTFNL